MGALKLPFGPSTRRSANLPAGAFSFLPVGPRLTFSDVQRLPRSPLGVRQAVEARVSSAGGQASPTLMLRGYGFLLAVAPLGVATRAAVFTAIESLPGLRVRGAGRDLLGRTGELVAVDDIYDRIELLLDAKTGSVLAVQQRVLRPQPIYPGIGAGTLIESDTFSRSL